jgi:hypothetical protein
MSTQQHEAEEPMYHSEDEPALYAARTRPQPLWRRPTALAIGSLVVALVVALVVILVVVTAGCATMSAEEQARQDTIVNLWKEGFSSADDTEAMRLVFRDKVSRTQIGAYMKEFSRLPHIAGSERNLQLADDYANNLRSFGFDEVRVDKLPILLADDISRSVNVTSADGNTVTYRCALDEPNIMGEEDYDKAVKTMNGFAGQGLAAGPVVWANYGRLEDFEAIKSINLAGTIVVVRYGKIFRGNKAKLAEQRGAIGVIIVMDPADVGSDGGKRKVFPAGPWANNRTVQRGSIYTGDGDPLTPTWPSEYGGPRVQMSDLHDDAAMFGNPLPKIPIQPMGYGDAAHLLKNIGGNAMPDEAMWKSTGFASDLGGKIGPSSTYRVSLEVRRNLVVKTIANVIGTIRGKVEPDRVVLIGGHRDAWTYGAEDPISGLSSVMEFSRVMGSMMKENNFRPRRTIQVVSWDAEEWAIIGSTEYVEGMVEELRQRAVCYINLDIAVSGMTNLEVGGSPSTLGLVTRNLGSVILPTGKTMDSLWGRKNIAPPGSGSDHMPFIQLAGVPVLDIGLGDDAYEAVYHSNYDCYYWVSTFGDPGFHYHKAMVQFVGGMVIDLATSNLLPLNTTEYARSVHGWVDSTATAASNKFADFTFMQGKANSFVASAQSFDAQVALAKKQVAAEYPSVTALTPYAMRALNDKAMLLERVFLGAGVKETGSQFFKHVLFTPSATNSYGSTVMPLMVDALATGNAVKANFAIGRVAQFIGRAAVYLNTTAV